jgi:hypothetical protein
MNSDSKPPGKKAPSKKVRWPIWTAIGGGIVAVLAVIVIFVLPSPIARWVIASELEEMGLTAQGVETVELDLWNSELWLGPLEIGLVGQDPAKVERLGLQYSFGNLFQRRALAHAAIIEGIDIEVVRRADGTIAVNEIELETLLAAKGEAPEEEEEPWGAGLDEFDLRESRMIVSDQEVGQFVIEIDQLTLQGFRTWQPDDPGLFRLMGRVNDMTVITEGEARPFSDKIDATVTTHISEVTFTKIEQTIGSLGLGTAEGSLTADVETRASLFSDGRIDTTSQGVISLSALDVRQESGESVAIESLSIGVDLGAAMAPDGATSLSGKIDIEGGSAELRTPDATASVQLITAAISEFEGGASADGSVNVNADVSLALSSVKGDGGTNVGLENLSVDLSELDMSGDASAFDVTGTGRVRASALEAVLPEDSSRPAAELSLAEMGMDLARLTAEMRGDVLTWQANADLSLSGLEVALPDGAPLSVRLGGLTLTSAILDPSRGASAETLTLTGLEIDVTEGAFEIVDTSEDVPADTEGPPGKTPDVRLGTLVLADPAVLRFTDASTSPEVQVETVFNELTIVGLDTGDPAQRTELKLTAAINEFTEVDISGWVLPFAASPAFDLQGIVSALELPVFSPYAAALGGVNLESGRLSTTSQGKVIDDALDAEVNIDLVGLEFSPLSPEDEARLSDTAGIPIETAVALLQDGDGRIELSVPVSGDLENPEFDLGQIINRAIGNAIQSAITGTLTLLFPPVMLLSMFDEEGDGGVAFQPIGFTPEGDEISPEGSAFLDNLGSLLAERPKLSIKVCGRATATDFEFFVTRLAEARMAQILEEWQAAAAAYEAGVADVPAPPKEDIVSDSATEAEDAAMGGDEAVAGPPKPPDIDMTELKAEIAATSLEQARSELTKLATDRTRAVRRDLSERLGIPAERVAECRPVFDPEDEGEPRVEVGL